MHAIKARCEGNACPRPEIVALRERATDFLTTDRGEDQRIGTRRLNPPPRGLDPAASGDREVVRPNAVVNRLAIPSRRIVPQRQLLAAFDLYAQAFAIAAQ